MRPYDAAIAGAPERCWQVLLAAGDAAGCYARGLRRVAVPPRLLLPLVDIAGTIATRRRHIVRLWGQSGTLAAENVGYLHRPNLAGASSAAAIGRCFGPRSCKSRTNSAGVRLLRIMPLLMPDVTAIE